MTDRPRRHYRIRRALAGSFLAAAAAASLSGVPAQAADASPLTSVSDPAPDTLTESSAERGPLAYTAPSPQARLDGVRSELDQAVLLRLVTPEQADGFYAQLERRVAAGL
ncbi:hypothetical protein AC792_06620 [Arthrobacter sp. RIT-PI-e]|uniref:hypothetical protein n=1 Tax=Arthrobacter sp. RIT-PI-e TaxID=1681197 RepID=UPI000675CCB2|nr:hypothetical protein [Arthrobacter sp. RIT-PI-e]KNC19400.1 hypothetical protein AC792_06620 [Arthrobacter sp. RIT-PI-e]